MVKRVHHLKTWPEPWHATMGQRKLFEFRRDDRGFAVGDELHLHLWDPGEPAFSGIGRGAYIDVSLTHAVGEQERSATLFVGVTYLLCGRHGVPDGFVVTGIRLLPDDARRSP